MSRNRTGPIVAELGERLAARGRRPTAQRLVVLESLRRSARTLTAQELYDQLRRTHPLLGRATVFRALDSLVEAGLAQRFERPGHVYAYAACSAQHHHHLVCTQCDRTIEVDEASIGHLVAGLAREHGFTVDHASLDFYGRCRRCVGRAG